MTNYTVFRVAEALYEDFQSEIAKDRLQIYARHYFENGNEVKVESFDEDGTLLSRSEHDYNEAGKEIEAREYMGEEKKPFKIKMTLYNEAGNVISIVCNYGDEEYISETHQYDHMGRLVQSDFLDEDGFGQAQVRTYNGDCPKPHSILEYEGEILMREITYTYEYSAGEYLPIDETTIVNSQPWDSRVRKLYDRGEIPNGVIDETYNTDGDFLEETREIADVKGNVLQRSWHTDDAEDSFPFQVQTYKYDNRGNCIYEELTLRNARMNLTFTSYDSRNRKQREFFDGAPATMLIYVYAD